MEFLSILTSDNPEVVKLEFQDFGLTSKLPDKQFLAWNLIFTA